MNGKFENILGQRFHGAREIEVAIGRPDSSNVIWSNRVKSTKYHFMTFIVENLYEQFHLLANIYFVGVAILQLIPETSDSGGVPTALISFVPLLFLRMVADGWQDFNRYKNDKRTNMKPAKRVVADFPSSSSSSGSGGSFCVENTTWGDLRVGDVIQISYGEDIPADCVMLYASAKTYVETKNLDGESSLKVKVPVQATQKFLADNPNPLCSWPRGVRLNYEVPSSKLYSFRGKMLMGADVSLLSVDNLLLRGSSFRSPTATAVIVYTGHMTRVFCNSSRPTAKVSRLAQWYDKHVISLVVIQVVVSLIIALTSIAMRPVDANVWYLYIKNYDSIWITFFVMIGRMLLLFAFFVPITLLIALDLVRAIHRYFIVRDVCMSKEGDPPVEVHNSSILEDMGVVSHIFTDKTGTLTQNLMTYCAIALPGKFCVCSLDEEDAPVSNSLPFCHPLFPADKVHATLSMANQITQDDFALYVISLALCHSADLRMRDGVEGLEGPSPDELALICGAQVLGIRFAGRPSATEVELQLSDQGKLLWARALGKYGIEATDETTVSCTQCAVLEFDNVRKRMSVIVDIGGRKILLCKGADNSMLDVHGGQDPGEIVWLEHHLLDLSVLGLRTLVIGVRAVSDEEYLQWKESWEQAQILSDDKAKEESVMQCLNNIESGLRLVGVSGVEDQLQEDVSATLNAIRDAGIKIWMLTGDKVETAVTIAKSCDLIKPTTHMSTFQDPDICAIRNQLAQLKRFLQAGKLLRTHGFHLDWDKQEKLERKLWRAKSSARSDSMFTIDERNNPHDALTFANRRTNSLYIASGMVNPLPRTSTVDLGVRSTNLSHEAMQRADTIADLLGADTIADFHPVSHEAMQRADTIAGVLGVEVDTDVVVFDSVSIIITGECMHTILNNLKLRRDFFQVALSSCHSVICCRSTPIQKSLVVTWSRLYLESRKQAMLAIGDGTNDVGMILSAHIGIGILGKEGSQAARSADIAIPKFKYLSRLLFVHGRELWRRNTYAMYFTTFKTVAFCMASLFFNMISEFSGGDIYDPMLKQWFNFHLTGLPILLFAIFDQQFPTDILHRSARLYSGSISLASHGKFFYWFLTALAIAAICLYIPVLCIDVSIEIVGHFVYFAMLIPTNILLLVDSSSTYWFTWVLMPAGLVGYPLLLRMNDWWGRESLGDQNQILLFQAPIFWFAVFLAGTVSMVSHSLRTAAISNVLTPVAAIRHAWGVHKIRIKNRHPKWREEQKYDSHFWTRGFEPDEACEALLGSVPLAGAVVPWSPKPRLLYM